ncbi:uncharacterized protein LOC127396039 [Apus apus]|uniref:uncharacterized protein LOC127396039 n=1 Tax=Apus apus TaxID=8895 RepID=UPI0021F8BE1B|nr:uncharacterized protein LOC127396039 [Apus apus]
MEKEIHTGESSPSVDPETLFKILETCNARPSVSGQDWAKENWHNLQSVADRISALQKEAKRRFRKGKGIVCAVLGACLVSAAQHRADCQTQKGKVIASLQTLVESLQDQIAGLKRENVELREKLESEKAHSDSLKYALWEERTSRSEQGAEVRMNELEEKGDYIRRVSPIYPQKELREAKARSDKIPQLRPLIKREYYYEDPDDEQPSSVTKEVPYSATELAKLKKEFARNAKESETEYVWRVSLSGGDQILLTEKEAEGYWGPGVFLTTGDQRAPWSLTQRAAYWASGLDPLERGDPLAIVGTMEQILESVQKAACLQMMHNGQLNPYQESPMLLTVDPERMTPLIRGLPESLRPVGIQLQGQIKATSPLARLEEIVTQDHNTQKSKTWTWGEIAQELINYGRKYGPINPSPHRSETKAVRWASPSPRDRPPGKGFRRPPPNLIAPTARRDLWHLGWQKGIPRELMDGTPTDVLRKMVTAWPDKPPVSAVREKSACEETIASAPPLIDLKDPILTMKAEQGN